MVGTCGLQEGVAEEVAQGNSNMVDLHEKVQDRVDGHDLPVNQAFIAVGDGTEEDLFPVGDGHEELVQVGTSHAESVIEGTDNYTPTSVQSVVPSTVTGEIVTEIQQFQDVVELIAEWREVCTICEYETPQGTRAQALRMFEIHWGMVHGLHGGGGATEALVHDVHLSPGTKLEVAWDNITGNNTGIRVSVSH